MNLSKRDLGRRGEAVAVAWLERLGYRVVARNFYSRQRELDIVAWAGAVLCFIEVKLRTSTAGSAERATGALKRLRLSSAARHYCLTHGVDIGHTSIRFEQVSLYCDRVRGRVRGTRYILP